jgi:hypothetical protein
MPVIRFSRNIYREIVVKFMHPIKVQLITDLRKRLYTTIIFYAVLIHEYYIIPVEIAYNNTFFFNVKTFLRIELSGGQFAVRFKTTVFCKFV